MTIAALRDWFRLLKASWHSASASIASQTLTATAAALAGRALGPASYGRVVAIAAYYGWFSLLAGYPVYAMLSSYMARADVSEQAKRQACSTAAFVTCVFALISVGAALLLMPLLMPSVAGGPLRPVAVAYAVVFAALQIRGILDFISQSAGWLKVWSISNVVATAAPVAALGLWIAVASRMRPHDYIMLLCVVTVPSTLLSAAMFVARVGGVRRLVPRVAMVRPLIAAGAGPWLCLLGGVGAAYGLRSLIAINCPSSQLGYYEAAMALTTWMTGVALAVTIPALSQWSAAAATGALDEVRADLRRRQKATTAVLCVPAVICLAAAEPVLRVIYGVEFVGAGAALRVALLTWPIAGAGGWYWSGVFSLGQPARMARPNLTSNAVILLGAFGMLKYTSWGPTGVLLAYFVGCVVWLADWEIQFRHALSHAAALRSPVADVAESSRSSHLV